LLHANPARPVIVVEDRFTGEPAEPWVLHWNLMAEGAVQTPAGPYTPEPRLYSSNNRPDGPKQVPSVGPVKPLAAGVNLLRFTGYPWGQPAQALPAVDFDVALVATEPQEFYLGNWAHEGLAGGGHVFQQINGRSFEERQHRLCVRGRTGFTTVILPRRKTAAAPNQPISCKDGIIRIDRDGELILIAPAWHAHRRGDELTTLTTVTDAAAELDGIAIHGGPTEIVLTADRAVITAHGAPGPRRLRLPGRWSARAPLTRDGEDWILPHAGGTPTRIELPRP
jgi:hypothetical protein